MKKFNLRSILFSLLAISVVTSCGTSKSSSMNNFVARMQVDEPIEGVCDNSNVLVILPLENNGQVEARASISDEEIMNELNAKVSFLKDNPNYEDEGMVNLIINCKGEMVRCQIDNETKSPELDEQIVAVFSKLKKWTPGKLHEKSVDTMVLYSFKIKNGKIDIS